MHLCSFFKQYLKSLAHPGPLGQGEIVRASASVVAWSEIGKGVPFELFFICQWCERMYLCDFVALSVRMCVAGANKVEGTIS